MGLIPQEQGTITSPTQDFWNLVEGAFAALTEIQRGSFLVQKTGGEEIATGIESSGQYGGWSADWKDLHGGW